MYNFCTLFDSNYAAQGLTMYYSLKKHCPDFHLYIFAFDDTLMNILNIMKLEHVTAISLKEFEDEDLLRVKPTRTKGEYCWTCSSSTILYCLKKYSLDHCTYIDSDIYFFSNPASLIDEMGTNDVSLSPHRYTDCYDQTELSGIYCVQFMTFRNTENGINILNWWRNACIEWCYSKPEDGKFGDQKYLDDWPTRFKGIHILENLGGGVAPWNMHQYTFKKTAKGAIGTESSSGKKFEVVFFHFHGLKCNQCRAIKEFVQTHYSLTPTAKKIIYKAYLPRLINTYHKIRKLDKNSLPFIIKNVYHKSWIFTIGKRIINGKTNYYYWI